MVQYTAITAITFKNAQFQKFHFSDFLTYV